MNRRQRRAQQGSALESESGLKSADDIPLARPPSENSNLSKPKPKTLLDIAAERQAQLQPGTKSFNPSKGNNIVNVQINKDGNIVPNPSNPSPFVDTIPADEEVNPLLDTLFLSTSLSALHFTLETLTVHQYAQELKFLPIISHTIFMAFPTLFLLIHLFHGHLIPRRLRDLVPENASRIINALTQVLYMAIANVAGAYLIQLTNDRGYYAVMKNAPGIGTIWVWTILELGLLGALVGVVGPGIYAWWNGYSVL